MMNSFLKTGIASALFFICGSTVAAQSPASLSSKANNQAAETRIVGGEEAAEENWPWMTAYVFVNRPLETSLSIDNTTYVTNSFGESPLGTVSGEIIDCNLAEQVCENAQEKICLIERGEIDFSEKVSNCEAGGGVGAIIYNNEPGNISGTLSVGFQGLIPVIAVSQTDGVDILTQVGATASLSVTLSTSSLQQDATCGASFLGNKWVLTAAHCVEDGNPNGFKMNVGEYDLSNGAENAIDIANIYIHSEYDADVINNDIAIIELVSSVEAEAVQIADPEVTDQYAIDNSVTTVAGWGGRVGYAPGEGPTSDFPNILHKVDLLLSTNEQCMEVLADTRNTSVNNTGITDSMICAAIPEGGKASCQGDSGGPLVINTGSGVQQVGIVSWGFGCAEAGYPGVYTRVSKFKNWISAITKGIAITQQYDFGVGLEGEEQTSELTVTNNSDIDVALSFEQAGSSDFTFDTSNCATLNAGSSCVVNVSYLPTVINSTQANETSAELTITADNDQIQTSYSIVSGTAISSANDLASSAGTASDAVTLFSGGTNGASQWTAHSVEGLQSGTTGDVQDSILVAQIEGKGVLTFDWSVSSEENTDDPDDPYDTLYLYVDGELLDFISGDVAFTEYTIDLSEGSHVINWTYSKDLDTADGQDKGFIRNLVFTEPVVQTPEPPVTAPPPSSSGGGSLGWAMLCLFGLVFRLKNKR